MRKIAAWVLCFCLISSSMTVNAAMISVNELSTGTPSTESGEEESSAEEGTTEETVTGECLEIPNVVGMNYADAEEALAGISVEIIRIYAASGSVPENEVISQSVVGKVTADEVKQIILTVSEGDSIVKPQKLTEGGTHGFAVFFAEGSNIVIDGDFSDWADKPYSWEYGYDNSGEVWGDGFYVDGEKVVCEKGTFNNKVRHKISLFCDGENVYVYVQFAKTHSKAFSGMDFMFFVDGKQAAYQLFPVGIENIYGVPEEGIYDVDVKDRNTYQLADGASAKFLVHENGLNNELEVKIPLETLKMHNSNIDIENISTIQFKSSHLTYRPVTSSGADTLPYVWAVLALMLVPTSACLIRKYYEEKRTTQR